MQIFSEKEAKEGKRRKKGNQPNRQKPHPVPKHVYSKGEFGQDIQIICNLCYQSS